MEKSSEENLLRGFSGDFGGSRIGQELNVKLNASSDL